MDKKFTEVEKLDLLLKYYKTLKPKTGKSKVGYKVENYDLFTYLINLCEFSGFPTIVSDLEFRKSNLKTLYRGAENIDYHANLLCDYDYHYGYGMYGHGIYVIDSFDVARRYGRNNLTNILELKFAGKILEKEYVQKYLELIGELFDGVEYSTFIKHATLNDKEDEKKFKTISDFYLSLTTEDKQFFQKLITANYSILPILLDYDGIDNNCLIIFNRKKIIVSESEFNRITSVSKNYQGGVINFDKKGKDEFLME